MSINCCLGSPLRNADLNKSYLALLTAPRSGSTWLSELLALNGLAYPAEHLWRLRDRFSVPNSEEFIRQNLQLQYLSYVFHMKLNPILNHFPPIMYSSKLMAQDWNYISKHGGINSFVSSAQISTVILWRKDIYLQAFSYSTSMKTGSWYNTNVEQMDLPPISFEEFMESLQFMIAQYEDIYRFYNLASIKPLVLNYERLKKYPAKGLSEIFSYCEKEPLGDLNTEAPIKNHNYKERDNILSKYMQECSKDKLIVKKIDEIQTLLESITHKL